MLGLVVLTRLIEGRYPGGPSTASARSVTGEPYVTIGVQLSDEGRPTIAGTVDEGKCAVWARDEGTACIHALAAFDAYAAERSGTLYWRQKPTLEWDEQHGYCKVYMRLLISDKEEVAA